MRYIRSTLYFWAVFYLLLAVALSRCIIQLFYRFSLDAAKAVSNLGGMRVHLIREPKKTER